MSTAAVGTVSFRICRDGEAWLVAEDDHVIGGIFATLVAALDFVDREAARFREARAIVELSPRLRAPAGRSGHAARG